MNSWIVSIFVATLYIHLFNAIAKMYLDSDRTLGLTDLYRRVVPPVKVSIEL
jgi:hypothetical protein